MKLQAYLFYLGTLQAQLGVLLRISFGDTFDAEFCFDHGDGVPLTIGGRGALKT